LIYSSKVFGSSFFSAGDVFTDGGELLVKVLSELIDDVDFSGSLRALLFVFNGLAVTPGSLGGKGSLDVLELDSVVLKGLRELVEETLGGVDEGGKSSLLVGQGLLLVLEGVQEGGPIGLGLLLVLLGDFLFLNDTLTDVLEEI